MRTKRSAPPDGFEVVEGVLRDLETKMREGQSTPLLFSRSPFCHDALAVSMPPAAEVAPHEGKRKSESIWPILRIHHQRSRYIYEAYYKKHEISREVYDYCVREGHADANLIAKWRKPGFGSLCCLGCAQTKDHNFGTTCVCRVPKVALDAGRSIECKTCGCRGCAGGDDRFEIVDVAATVEARGGLPPQLGYGGPSGTAPPAPVPAAAAAAAPAPAAAAAPVAVGPPGFFPPSMQLPPETLQALAAQQAAVMAQFAGGAAPPAGMPPPAMFMMMMAAAQAAGGGGVMPQFPPGFAMPPFPSGGLPPGFPAASLPPPLAADAGAALPAQEPAEEAAAPAASAEPAAALPVA